MFRQINKILAFNFLCNKKELIFLIIGMFFYTYNNGQVTTTIDFETVGSGYTPSITNGNGIEKVFNRTNTNIAGVSNEDGFYWACEDLNVIDPVITLNQIDVTGSSSFSFYIDMVAHHFDKWDVNDELKITYSLDGGAFQNLIWVQSMPGNNKDTPPGIDLSFDGNGDCGVQTSLPAITNGTEASSGCNISSSDFKTFSKLDIPLSANSSLDIKLEFFDLDKKDEGIYLDNIIITQTTALNSWNGSVSTSWLDVSNWDLGVVPSFDDNVIIPNVINQPVISSNVEIASLIVDLGSSITINSNTFLVSGNSLIDGTLNIDLGTFDANGTFDAGNGAINFTNNGFLTLSNSMVSSLGDLNTSIGTVVYDGFVAQNVLSDTYFNLLIANSSTKTVSGNIDLNGSLTIQDDFNCVLDLDSKRLRVKGDLTVGSQGYLDATDPSCRVVFRGSASKVANITDFSGTDSIKSEETVIFNGVANWDDSPFNAAQPFGYVRCIYPEAEIGIGSTTINSLFIYVNNPSTFNFTGSIYIGSISATKTEFNNADDDDYPDLSTYVKVLDEQSIVFNASGWVEIPINDYNYSGSGGLEIIFENHTNSTGTGPEVAHYDLNDGLLENRMIWSYQGDDNFAGGTRGRYVVNMRFKKTTQFPVSYEASFNDLKVNGGGDLTLNSPIKVKGVLTLNNGKIFSTSTNKLSIENNSTTAISGASIGSYVVGPIDRNTNSTADYVLPVGDAINYRPVFITPNSTTQTTYTAEYKNTAHSSISYDINGYNNTPTTSGDNIDHVAMGCWWDIERSAIGSDCYVALNWDNNSGVDSPADIVLAHWNGTSWDKIGTTLTGSDGTGSATATAGRVKSDLFTGDFSPFNLGSTTGNNSLPVDLLSFTANCSNNEVEVNFSVLSQENNDYFTIERSLDAIHWEYVTEIAGEGNINTQKDYSFIDENSYSNLSYYRLRQTDFDGNFKTYSPVSINCNGNNEGVGLNIYPNPTKGLITYELDLQNYQGDHTYFSITDATGKVVLSDYINLNKGYNENTLDLSALMKGVYFLQFHQTKDHIKAKRIIRK